MAFRTKRGRPRLVKKEIDKGTPELQQKQRLGLTAEPLDLLLQKKRINARQHAAGRRLRWLYTLVFGSPLLTAGRLDLFEERTLKLDNAAWRQKKELEYQQAICLLKARGYLELIQAVCIFEERAKWFSGAILGHDLKTLPPELKNLEKGLSLLADYFEGSPRRID